MGITPYYQDEWATLYHGNCQDILPHLGPVDLVLTDPPYGIGFAAQPTKWQRLAGKVAEYWDDDPIADLLPLIAHGTVQIVWGGNYYQLPPSRGWLCWHKPDAPLSMSPVELAWTNQDRNAAFISHSISATNRERVGHPTQKPLRIITWCLLQFSGETTLDPFTGSGTTLVAAKQLGRHSIGIEIEERYCKIAADRLKNTTPSLFAPVQPKPQQLALFHASDPKAAEPFL